MSFMIDDLRLHLRSTQEFFFFEEKAHTTSNNNIGLVWFDLISKKRCIPN